MPNLSSNNPGAGRKAIAAWLLTGCLLIFLMVLLGGITRLTQSGLSMVDWKITGSLPPMSDAAWEAEFSKYRQSPEFRLVNAHFTVGEFRKIFWWEYVHRMTGRLTGLVFLLPFAWFTIRKKFPKGFFAKSLVLFGLGACQGLLGWIMVKSGLDKVPHVSHYLLAAHLAMAFTTFGFTFWFVLDLFYPGKKRQSAFLRKPAVLLLFLVGVQVIYGAFLAGLKGGYLFPTFPMMGDAWIAPEVFGQTPGWKNVLENGAGVQFIHRVLATLVVLLTGVIVYRSRKLAPGALPRKIAGWLAGAVMLQFTLGVLTLLFHVPVAIASAHQAGAFLLLSLSIFLFHSLSKGQRIDDREDQHADPDPERSEDQRKARFEPDAVRK